MCVRIPIVTVQGAEWQNRVASHILEQAGLQVPNAHVMERDARRGEARRDGMRWHATSCACHVRVGWGGMSCHGM